MNGKLEFGLMEIEWLAYVFEIELTGNWIVVKVVKCYGMFIAFPFERFEL